VRAAALHVDHLVMQVEPDAARHVVDVDTYFHVVGCIGVIWIGDGLTGTLDRSNRRVRAPQQAVDDSGFRPVVR